MYVCVDFDGTVVDHRFPHIGEEAPGAVGWLKKLQDSGAKIILNTMRSDTSDVDNHLSQAVDWFIANGIELFGVNRNPTQDRWTTSPKVYGNLYIDDAAVGCPLIHPEGFKHPCVDWSIVGPLVESILIKK